MTDKQKLYFPDLIGKTFGYLTVLDMETIKQRSY